MLRVGMYPPDAPRQPDELRDTFFVSVLLDLIRIILMQVKRQNYLHTKPRGLFGLTDQDHVGPGNQLTFDVLYKPNQKEPHPGPIPDPVPEPQCRSRGVVHPQVRRAKPWRCP